MEFICRFHDGDELNRVRELLSSKGIPTFAPRVEGRKMGAQWALFACINEQADDVRKLLHDPAHDPAFKVDAKAFERMLEHPDISLLTRWATAVAIVVFVLFALLMLAVVRLSS
ncbi:hypothetical protein [Lysobacter arvi]|uniref:DUF2007 domain-containing protein n=1 Tax=Lysobacter arvi TaxID=3038776 RepID=A0ABU1CER4_9GAMM|nr:hypothetical protein [Lysobacter arvi]MDR0183414.1 hypothetical protein [Lysobacter arvi]